MAWIKRNLFFVIGTVVALSLMGAAGWYLYSKWQLNNEIWAKLNEDYSKLKQLNAEKPHPGSGNVDNIKIAKEQTKELREFIEKTRAHFQRITPIPDLPKITDQDFSSALSRSIDQLAHAATNASVMLPSDNYAFSFSAQRSLLQRDQKSLGPLAVQLGEVKAICEILFSAKVNSLDNLRRERVSPNDLGGSSLDYIPEKTITNAEMALLTPYEVTFKSFSAELASVLAGFASSPYGIIVRTINVELAPAEAAPETAPQPSYQPQPVYISPAPTQQPQRREGDQNAAFRARYGLGGARSAPPPPPTAPPVQYIMPGTTAPAASRGMAMALDEQKLRVTIALSIVKLVPKPAPK